MNPSARCSCIWLQCTLQVKGEEAKVELLTQQQAGHSLEGGVPNERSLMNQIVQLERDVREKDRVIEGLKERGNSPTPGAVNEARVLRQENEDLRVSEREGEMRREWILPLIVAIESIAFNYINYISKINMHIHVYTSAMLSIFGRVGATLYELQAQSVYLMSYTIKWPVTKCNTARSANLHVLVYTLLHREAPYQVE